MASFRAFALALLLATALSGAELKLGDEGIRQAIAHGQQFKSAQHVKPEPTTIQFGGVFDAVAECYETVHVDTDFLIVARAAAEAKNKYLELSAEQAAALLSGRLRILWILSGPMYSVVADAAEQPDSYHLVIRIGDTIIQPAAKRSAGVGTASWYLGSALVPFGDALMPVTFGGSTYSAFMVYEFELPREYWSAEVELVSIHPDGKRKGKKLKLARLP